MRIATPYVLLLLVPLAGTGALLVLRLGPGLGGRPALLWLRIAAIAVLIVALAQPEIEHGARVPTIVVVDRSASVSPAMWARERTWLRELRSSGSCVQPCRFVEFDGGSRLVPIDESSRRRLAVPPQSGATNIEGALRLAIAAAPTGARIVLLSDGEQTTGDAQVAAAAARTRQVTIDTVDLGVDQRPDAALTRFDLPASAHVGDTLAALLTIHSTVASSATVTLTRDNVTVGRQDVTVKPGDNPLALTLAAQSTGWHVYRAKVSIAHDHDRANDALDATVYVSNAPRVLILSDGDSDAARFAQLLRGHDFGVRQARPSALGSSPAALRRYDAVVLDDLPASALRPAQVSALGVAVRQAGLGLLVLGGARSLSLGGYAGSPLERMLPVSSLQPGNRQRGTVGLELVIDRSGSMADLGGGVPKIAMAKVAARTATTFAAKRHDELGIVSFDVEPHLLVSMQRVTPGVVENEIDSNIGTLTANGGTNIHAALKAAVGEILRSNAPNRHVILMTDGISDPGNYASLLARLNAHKVSISTVALGAGADRKLLRSLAKRGHGRFYATSNARTLPSIFAKEARLSIRPVGVRGRLAVSVGADAPAVASLLGRRLGALRRNVVTDLKRGALPDLIGTAPQQQAQPVLAQWQYGVGRVAVWTTSTESSWSGALGSSASLWNDTLRWLDRGTETSPALPSLTTTEPLQVVVDPLSDGGSAFDLAHLQGSVSSVVGGRSSPLRFAQVGPSRYLAPLPGGFSGAVRVSLSGERPVPVTAVLPVAYPAEFRPSPGGAALLAQLAAATGGRRLAPGSVANLSGSLSQLWPILTAVALVLFLAAAIIRELGGPDAPPEPPGSIGEEGSTPVLDESGEALQVG